MASLGLYHTLALPGIWLNSSFYNDDNSFVFLINSQIKKGPHPVTSKLKSFVISGSLG